MRNDEPIERRPDAQVVQDRQAQVAADGPQSIGHGPRDVGSLGVAGGVESMDQQRQLLERVVMDVGGDPGTLRLGGRDDQVALEDGAGRESGERPDREPAGQQDEDEPDHQGERERRAVGCERQGRRGADRPRTRSIRAAGRSRSASTGPPAAASVPPRQGPG